MERLAKQLKLEKEELERLKAEVNGMEHDLMQRRLRRVSCTTAIPTVSPLVGLCGQEDGRDGCLGHVFFFDVLFLTGPFHILNNG